MNQCNFRQDIFAGVDSGLVVASFLAAVSSSLIAPLLTDGMSRLWKSLPRVEITLPDDNTNDTIDKLEDDKEEDMDDLEASNKVKRASRFNKYIPASS